MSTLASEITDDGLFTPEVGPWAEEKYRLVQLYSGLFSTGMKHKWNQRVYIDLFCGAGKARIRSSGKVVLASPLLALAVQDKYDVYIFCDEDPKSVDALRSRAEAEYPEIVPYYIVGDCNIKVDEILSHVPRPGKANTVLTFCFVDPFSLRLQFQTIQRMSQFRMDFLILIPFGMDVNRNKTRYTGKDHRRIEHFLGMPGWRSKWLNAQKTDPSFQRFLAREFANQMIALGFREEALSSMIQVRSSEKNLPLYQLAFFSQHELGYKFWREGQRYIEEPEIAFPDQEDV